jgi:hypothetical protein
MQMKMSPVLEAKVVRVVHGGVHRVSTIVEGKVVPLMDIPAPALVRIERIEKNNGGFLLDHVNEMGESITDTWHATVEDAKRQARHEFGIEESDWVDVTERKSES